MAAAGYNGYLWPFVFVFVILSTGWWQSTSCLTILCNLTFRLSLWIIRSTRWKHYSKYYHSKNGGGAAPWIAIEYCLFSFSSFIFSTSCSFMPDAFFTLKDLNAGTRPKESSFDCYCCYDTSGKQLYSVQISTRTSCSFSTCGTILQGTLPWHTLNVCPAYTANTPFCSTRFPSDPRGLWLDNCTADRHLAYQAMSSTCHALDTVNHLHFIVLTASSKCWP